MATPASRFRPSRPESTVAGELAPSATTQVTLRPAVSGPDAVSPSATGESVSSAGAVEFDAVVPGSGQLGVLPRVQRIRMGQALTGRLVRIWVDQRSVHVHYQGQLVKTVPSNLSAADLQELRHRGAQPAGPSPAAPAPLRLEVLPATAAVEVDRAVDGNGVLQLAGHKLKAGTPLAGRRVTARLDGHPVHIIDEGVLAKTLPSSITAEQRAGLRGPAWPPRHCPHHP
jgi:hypothetical protein